MSTVNIVSANDDRTFIEAMQGMIGKDLVGIATKSGVIVRERTEEELQYRDELYAERRERIQRESDERAQYWREGQ